MWRGYLICKDTFPRRRGGGYLGWFLLGMCRLPLSAPHPLQSILWPIIDPKVVTFGQICNFPDPNLVTFFFYELTHFLNWIKNNLLFTYSTNILVRLLTVKNKHCITPKKSENVRPHHSHSSRDNATPSSDTSPLASCKEELPPPPGNVRLCFVITINEMLGKHSKQWLWLNFQSEL